MKLGFACKYLNADGKQFFPFRATTRTRFLRLDKAQGSALLYEIAQTNLQNLYLTLEAIATQPDALRMMRIGSDLLPLYTVPEAKPLFARFLPELYPLFARCGELARQHNIRLSFHPGQYSVLASDNPDVVTRALEDVEYHALCACLMGYGKTFQDFKINIHMNGKRGFDGFKQAFHRLSPEARLMLTVENDEISCSLDDVLQARALCPVVLDIHHHWVKENQFIQADDVRIAQITESWRGVRPVLHYSISQEGLIPEKGFPDQQQLAVPKTKLRAHSDYYFNATLNDWALSFSDFDIMCEVKMKNLARETLYTQAKSHRLVA
ncbi:UV damage endonuclease UvsE [Pantoea sp. BS_4]|uniref:UV damage repair endonuclease UvdE n=1 Tax=Pantoea stewartii TaxID=66269 RepID=A0AB34VAW0_9GAMM|nr:MULTISPECIES: UV damage endonuclease UvsE [Pantoea]KKW52398.1 UV damage repair endonuclease UvdE [Pantoea ananatis]KTS28119.1 UV damage repair endonuclease UvdE [Pantoea stewartii]KTS70997.1 UV damage repair endonuclease UvdE [Pantoea stewartii]KTS94176.1 UV damage repair endonuclease UvdE [Pantoea stewartii]KTT06587.1 UV damage repair endonuclease UvdE [Pantoea stewartii]